MGTTMILRMFNRVWKNPGVYVHTDDLLNSMELCIAYGDSLEDYKGYLEATIKEGLEKRGASWGS